MYPIPRHHQQFPGKNHGSVTMGLGTTALRTTWVVRTTTKSVASHLHDEQQIRTSPPCPTAVSPSCSSLLELLEMAVAKACTACRHKYSSTPGATHSSRGRAVPFAFAQCMQGVSERGGDMGGGNITRKREAGKSKEKKNPPRRE